VLYGHDLAQVLPDYIERGCPIERNIIESKICYLSKESGYTIGYRDAFWPKGSTTRLRFPCQFDRWYATGQAKGAVSLDGCRRPTAQCQRSC
jgi:hypothetical protein